MRFRIKRRGAAESSVLNRLAEPEAGPEKKPVSLAQELDNPYGRYYSKARSREELLAKRHD